MKESVWNAKGAIAEAIIPILVAYTDAVRAGDTQCLPTWVLHDDEVLPEDELIARWVGILESMIGSFELEISDHDLPSVKKDDLQRIGLKNFSKYYPHLWD